MGRLKFAPELKFEAVKLVVGRGMTAVLAAQR